MDKKIKILYGVIIFSIIYAVVATYHRVYIAEDYIILSEVECDPTSEQCYIFTCSQDEDSEDYDEECPDELEERDSYYKIVKKKLADIDPEIKNCDPHDKSKECPELNCEPGEVGCEVVYCDPKELGRGEECSLPDEYNATHPEEEEEEEEECLSDEECVTEESAQCPTEDEEGLSEGAPEETDEQLVDEALSDDDLEESDEQPVSETLSEEE